MRALLSFLPFFAFGFALQSFSVVGACLIAAGLGLVMTLGEHLLRGRSIKILEAGSVLLFGGLALVTGALHPGWSAAWIWVVVYAGLLLIAVVSLVIGRPFTRQYAREGAPPDLWNNPLFLAANMRITAVWTTAFAVMLLAQLAGLYAPGIPAWADTAASIGAALIALGFTSWYPAHLRRMHAAPTAAA